MITNPPVTIPQMRSDITPTDRENAPIQLDLTNSTVQNIPLHRVAEYADRLIKDIASTEGKEPQNPELPPLNQLNCDCLGELSNYLWQMTQKSIRPIRQALFPNRAETSIDLLQAIKKDLTEQVNKTDHRSLPEVQGIFSKDGKDLYAVVVTSTGMLADDRGTRFCTHLQLVVATPKTKGGGRLAVLAAHKKATEKKQDLVVFSIEPKVRAELSKNRFESFDGKIAGVPDNMVSAHHILRFVPTNNQPSSSRFLRDQKKTA